MEMRVKRAHTIFFLDYSTEVCLEGIANRKGKERPDKPWIEPVYHEVEECLTFIRQFPADRRAEIIQLLD